MSGMTEDMVIACADLVGRAGAREFEIGWEPGCDAEPIHVDGQRGDYTALQRAMGNRAARRRTRKRGT